MKSMFSIQWLSSTQPRKQRKYRYNAPLHIRGTFLHAKLAKDLKEKYSVKSLRVRTGDKVKILRGQFKGVENVVERVDVARQKVFVKDAELAKKDGGKTPYPIHASNLMITTVTTDDKKRFKKEK
jgi:large subunit ribosomal protein L24